MTPPQGGGRDREVPRSRLLNAADVLHPDRRSLLLEVITRPLHPTVLLVSVYLLLAGHDGVGGGFVAGLVAGLGLVLRYLAGGPHELGTVSPIDPDALIGGGLGLAGGYAVTGAVFGDGVLSGTEVSLDVPLLGHLDVATSLVFDTGVYVLVVGVVLDVLRTLGGGDDEADAPTGGEVST